MIMEHPSKKGQIVCPSHGSQEVGKGLEKKIKKDILYHGGNLDVQLPYRDSREQRAHGRTQTERPNLKAADEEADRQG